MTEPARQKDARLEDFPQWILYKEEPVPGKNRTTKVPYQAIIGHPKKASSNDPATWSDFATARVVLARRGDLYDGLGFVVTDSDPFTCVDFDDCVDHKWNIAPWAKDALDTLDTYAEFSPSGTGIHAWVVGTLPKGSRKKRENPGVEVYPREQYITVTFEMLDDTPDDPQPRQAELERVHAGFFPDGMPDEPADDAPRPREKNGNPSGNQNVVSQPTDDEVLEKMLSSRKAHEIEALMAGDLSAHDDNHSAADLALSAHVAFYTQDPDQIERIMDRSKLTHRDKWSSRRPRHGTYGRQTIDRAIRGLKDTYTWPEQAAQPQGAAKADPKRAPQGSPATPPETRHETRPETQHEPEDASDATDAWTEEDGPQRIRPKAKVKVLPKTFPVDAMPKSCRRLIREGAEAMRCPPEFFAFPMLASISAAIGTTRVLHINRSWKEPAAVFMTMVADPGSMKTPAAKIVMRPVKELQQEHKAEYFEDKEKYETKLRQHEVDKGLARKNDEPAPPPPDAPKMARTWASDTTIEGLAPILENNPRGVLIFVDELEGWVNSQNQYRSGGKGADTQHWLSLWTNEDWMIDRKSRADEPIMITSPFVSIYGGFTPAKIGELGSPMENGMLERFLFGYPVTKPYIYNHNEPSEEAETAYARLYRKLHTLQAGMDSGRVSPKALRFTEDADDAFGEAVNRLSMESVSPLFPKNLAAVWSKFRGYLARLSLIMAVCRAAEKPTPVTGVSPEEKVEAQDVMAAVAMIDYFKNHARRVFFESEEETPQDLFVADVHAFLTQQKGHSWEGSATDLMAILKERNAEDLPGSPKGLSQKLRSVSRDVQALHFEPGFTPDRSSRVLRLAWSEPPEDASDASDASVNGSESSESTDAWTQRTQVSEDASGEGGSKRTLDTPSSKEDQDEA